MSRLLPINYISPVKLYMKNFKTSGVNECITPELELELAVRKGYVISLFLVLIFIDFCRIEKYIVRLISSSLIRTETLQLSWLILSLIKDNPIFILRPFQNPQLVKSI